ncbi:TRAP transporter large permease [Ruthenibacterium sp. CLA-JM-H11]|uniref:TRAP transporter large permease n=1 Tax=Ruthenibacterium intestinale TaxID=3133163 RepID=A0ABV1GDZ4_9FIRM
MSTSAIAILLLVGGFIALIILRVPIPIALVASTAVTMIYLDLPLMTMVQQMAKSINSFSLMAVPFFILAGEIMGAGGISDKIVDFANAIVGRFRGGLACVNCLDSMFFGGISGSAVADVSSLGSIVIPTMVKSGYGRDFSIALTVTTSCQGVLIPPSHNMIFFALAAGGVSVGKLFLGGAIPGVLLGFALMAYSLFISVKRNYPKGEAMGLKQILLVTKDALIALFTAVIIMGGVSLGWFTATESAAIACIYAFLISMFVYKKLKWKDIPRILGNVVNTLCLSFSLIAAAGAFGYVLAFLKVPALLTNFLLSITDNRIILLLLINLMLLCLGCIMDMAPIIFIVTPILLPVVTALGMDPVHFGVMMIFNLAIGLCTPPVGSALFVGCAVGKSSIERVTKELLPMYAVMITCLLIVTFVPALSTWLPNLIMK